MATAKPETITAFTCESCNALKPLPTDGCGPCDECRKEDTDADLFNDTIGAAQDAFWKVVADRYRGAGVTTGDLEPCEADRFMEASSNAVAAWLLANKASKVYPLTEAAGDAAWGEDELRGAVITLAGEGELPAGWRVTYEYPGFFSFVHKDRGNFGILCTPDHDGADGAIAIDAQNDDGDVLRSWDNAPWPRTERIAAYKRGGGYEVARSFLKLVIPVLKECDPRKLVVEYDVTGMPEKDVEAFRAHLWDAAVECSMSAEILTNDVKPFDGTEGEGE